MYPASNTALAVLQKIKLGRGRLRLLQIFNGSAATAYLQLFDLSNTGNGTITLGSTPPSFSVGLGTLTSFNSGLIDWEFFNGLWVAATTTRSGLTAPASSIDWNALFE